MIVCFLVLIFFILSKHVQYSFSPQDAFSRAKYDYCTLMKHFTDDTCVYMTDKLHVMLILRSCFRWLNLLYWLFGWWGEKSKTSVLSDL